MWATEHSAVADVEPQAVWAALRDLHSGVKLSERSDTFELHGPFAVGTELSVTPQGQDTFRSTIVELTEPQVYADRTTFNGLTLLFRHTLTPEGPGRTRVTHRLEIDGAEADQVGPEMGPQISTDFPDTLDELFDAARRQATTGAA
ncbi:Polyketide cyclase / dehydrase and lipid transport [Frankia canadensis]|uniref:Polyketide cyclase / dehydrase and lipid transport n=1 Tax=Frankia canadensis TaxID=1836972 RepID=A0A2I2KWP4_9ACTN|nr:SRPBCC family protein [Frankia canadensis]SNQ50081.1 Polyketide cyclase / dehydrase and lipid transport [Frankia canadensis]SOU57371.1 Polyketide cyclase / dehydrase and lipid transport [Frankia canadensis]